MATGNRTLKLSILADVDDLKKKLNMADQAVDTNSSKITEFGKKAGLAFAAATAAVGAFAVKIAVDGIKAASSLNETVSKVGVLFGDSASKIEAFAETAAVSLGQTKQEALDASATFAIFGKSAGLTGDALVKFSTGFTSLASDLASFNDTSPEDAIQAIGAALRGETEPLRRYGVLLDDASLRQAALGLGIIKTTKEALTPQQKVLAAQELIYQQTSAAQGDFERTSDGLANTQRKLNAQLTNIRTEIGEALLPIVLKLSQIFTTDILPVIQRVADAFSSKSGGLTEGVFQYIDAIKLFLLPIIEGAKNAFNDIRGAIRENIDEFQEFFNVVKLLAPLIGKSIGAALNVVGDIAAVVINIISNVLGVIAKVVNTAIDAINVIIRAVNKIPGVNISQIGGIGTSAGGSTFTYGQGNPLSGVTSAVSSMPSSFNAGVASGTATSSSPTASATNKSAAQAAADLAIVATYGRVATTEENLRSGILPTPGVVNNITVNGAIDSESTARQIVDVLTKSYSRGGAVITTPFAI
jgi:phage-related protein